MWKAPLVKRQYNEDIDWNEAKFEHNNGEYNERVEIEDRGTQQEDGRNATGKQANEERIKILRR